MNQPKRKSRPRSAVRDSVRNSRPLHGNVELHPQELAEPIAVVTLDDLVSAKVTSGDPYSLRWRKKTPPKIVFQLEYDTEVALYAAFDADVLSLYAQALRRCWSFFGIRRGDRIVIFDYGTSPVSYLASASFTPYLARGAADILGCLPICNDGAANLSLRAVEIVKYVRPRILFLRTDCLHPFAVEFNRGTVPLSSYVDALVAIENEGVLAAADRDAYQENLGVPIYRLLRADAALFLAPECPRCGLFHIWQDLYHVELSEQGKHGREGQLLITNRFASRGRTTRYLSQMQAVLERPGCPAQPSAPRISI